ncbi:FAD binding domain-containing protein [Tepidibacter aestuarii]|uniref:FAD binding domain-containing protein n=1 Tax=Tepidibacter aestuarii TaxID=2925782 RepID=UPI0020BF2CA1|nr:FAD binding domain-containing protein [Tepidibacter aestuarii]CAH2213752.1 xanthine dehydrogenase FAD-binding subunit [Tepidibacter aestuarii]
MVNSYRAQSLREALEIRQSKKVILLAGGTDLMVKRKNWSGVSPKFEQDVLFIGHLKELKRIEIDKNYLKIGSNCTLVEMAESEIMPEYIKNILLNMASPAIRNIATIGGNICNASPAADMLPILYAMNAKLILKNIDMERQLNIEDFIYAPGKNHLKENELLKEIIIPLDHFDIVFHKKVGTRKATSLSKASFIGLANIENKNIKDIRIAFGSVAPTVIRDREIENNLKGLDQKGIEKNLLNIKDMYSKSITPIDDQRSGKEYRKHVSLELVENFLLNEIKWGALQSVRRNYTNFIIKE